jgi:DHA3 family macrolide efflux protein-like MFS transporter
MSETENLHNIRDKNEIKKGELKYGYKGFLIFWIGQLISIFGSEIVQFSIIWWITIETQNLTYLSVAMFLAFIPKIFIGPIAGVFVDRWNRKILLGVTDFLQALASLSIIILFLGSWESIWIIVSINTFRGICQSFHSPAVSAILPVIFPKKKLNQFNSIDYLFNGVISLIGPIIGAFMLLSFDVGQVLWVDLISCILAVTLLLPLKLPVKHETFDSNNQEKSRSFKRDFKDGLNIINTTKGLRHLITIAVIGNFLLTPINTLISYFISITHSGTSRDLGIVMASMQAGFIVGAIFLSMKKKGGSIKTFLTGIYLLFLGIMIIAVSGEFWLMSLGGFIATFGVSFVSIMLKTVVQQIIPAEKLGRVVSILGSLSTVTMPIGIIISGPLASSMGIGNLFLLSSILGILTTSLIGIFGNLKILEKTAEF